MDVASIQKGQLDAFSGQLTSFAKASGERLDGARAESATGAKQLREEVVGTLKDISETMAKTMKDLAVAEKVQLEAFSGQIASLTKTSSEKLDGIRTEFTTGAKQLREEVIAALKGITEATTKTMGELANIQKTQLETMSSTIGKLSDTNEKKLEAVRVTVEGKLQSMQIDNAKQLDQMRQTVDEKLQGTLEKRLGESFKQVSERLEQVHKGLGDMQTLATGVGDLKKVLTNVKTRGTWGEVQLGTLLEQVLNPDQFANNVATKDGRERVEFAIKLPGQGANQDETVWLPIDAKFPVEDYQRLIEAQERTDVEGVEMAGKQLENRVKTCARDISEKYLNPPKTTDFGILFLPIEGLFAEVIRRTGLIEVIQREYRVVIAGPTTLWSILNSLQMGFRTLAIQKRSSEVWNLLAAVKTEWTKYGDVLVAVEKKLHQASNTIEKAKVRSRAVGRKLKDVQELPAGEVATILPQNLIEDDENLGEGDRVADD
ncbi:MAG: DNA recombination protein RmuC [Deltaproteobacteria bacterium]|nr:DNA recombination protein RmuC [Deltaproteobacteria bacterium]MBW1965741.1 DNA recombination protein RmuC [Deltaproteobacteria bacterium]MBW2080869.1 DNA recombination protein RmuC [Deltaproteobacteria bacterium]MBW2351525.1 DNA recombination protein RmuC [Deltaproteobacteria bacterium]